MASRVANLLNLAVSIAISACTAADLGHSAISRHVSTLHAMSCADAAETGGVARECLSSIRREQPHHKPK